MRNWNKIDEGVGFRFMVTPIMVKITITRLRNRFQKHWLGLVMYSHFLHFFTSCTCHIHVVRPITCLQHCHMLATSWHMLRIVCISDRTCIYPAREICALREVENKLYLLFNALILVILSFFQCSSFSHHNSMSLRFFSSFFILSIFNLVLFHFVHFPFYSFSMFFISASTSPVVGAFGPSDVRGLWTLPQP